MNTFKSILPSREPRVPRRSWHSMLLVATVSIGLSGCGLFGAGVDERAPTVAIDSPSDFAEVAGTDVRITMTANTTGTEASFVSTVNVNINGSPLGFAELPDGPTGSWVLNWDSQGVENGRYVLEAIAFDDLEARGISAPVEVIVKNGEACTGAQTRIINPLEGEDVLGTVDIASTTEFGAAPVTKIDVLVDGITTATITQAPFTYEWDSSVGQSGNRTIQLRVFNDADDDEIFCMSETVTVNVIDQQDVDDGLVDNPSDAEGQARFRASGYSGKSLGSVAVGFNNDIYVGTDSDTLYAFTDDLRLKWKFGTDGPIESSPVVSNSNDIFVTSRDGHLYGLASNGIELWPSYNTAALVTAEPALGANGILYFGDFEGRVHAVNSLNGRLLWNLQLSNSPIDAPAVIAEDGTIIIGATDGFVYAINDQADIIWKSDTNVGSVRQGMALATVTETLTLPDGTQRELVTTRVYVVASGNLWAINGSDGTLTWDRFLSAGPQRSSPIVGDDGTVYVGADGGLMAVRENGNVLFTRRAIDVGTSVIDAQGRIYFMSGQTLTAINANNTPHWENDLNTTVSGPLTLNRSGLLLVAGDNAILNAINTNSQGLAANMWPMYQRNARHTGRIGIDSDD